MPRKSKSKSKKSFKFNVNFPIGPILLLVGLVLGFVVGGITKPNLPAPLSTNQDQPVIQTVSRVIDGDTVELSNGRLVRLTAVSAPELKEKYGKEAKAFLEEKLLNKKVKLEYERGYEKDRFNRLNAYVFVGDENINMSIVKQGLAKVVIYKKRRKLMYQDQLLPQINHTIQELAMPRGWRDKFLDKLDEEERQVNKDIDLLTQPIKQKLEDLKPKQDRIFNAFVDGIISQEIYLTKKNELVSKKRTLEEKLTNLITNPNSWIEPFRQRILLSHSANKIFKPDTKPEEKRAFLKKTGLNLFLQERKLGYIQQNPWSALRCLLTSRNWVPRRGIEPPRS